MYTSSMNLDLSQYINPLILRVLDKIFTKFVSGYLLVTSFLECIYEMLKEDHCQI